MGVLDYVNGLDVDEASPWTAERKSNPFSGNSGLTGGDITLVCQVNCTDGSKEEHSKTWSWYDDVGGDVYGKDSEGNNPAKRAANEAKWWRDNVDFNDPNTADNFDVCP